MADSAWQSDDSESADPLLVAEHFQIPGARKQLPFGQRRPAAGERQFGRICNAPAVCIMNSVSNTVVIKPEWGRCSEQHAAFVVLPVLLANRW